jgi:hypothetical protein
MLRYCSKERYLHGGYARGESNEGRISIVEEGHLLALYVLAFCRVTLGLTFLLAFVGKVRDLAGFRKAIINFRLLPPGLSTGVVWLALGAEVGIVVGMLLGESWLLPGFLLALILLSIFSTALTIVLVRKQRTTCNCFGMSNHPISAADLWRNGSLLVCAAGGCGIQGWYGAFIGSPGVLEWLLVAGGASVFVLLLTQLGELVQLFR